MKVANIVKTLGVVGAASLSLQAGSSQDDSYFYANYDNPWLSVPEYKQMQHRGGFREQARAFDQRMDHQLQLKTLSEKMVLFSSGRVTLVSLILFAVFIGYVLPDQAVKAETYSGGAGSPDGSFFYSSSDLYQMAEAYGDVGRAAYVHARFTFDMIWPLVYLFFLGAAISWSLGRAVTPRVVRGAC